MIFLDNDEWLRYPENKPDGDAAAYYDVVLKDGSTDVACWWLGGWYCYLNPYDIIGFKKEKREIKTYA